jgi:chromosome condensin MukBEF MukE localization factor
MGDVNKTEIEPWSFLKDNDATAYFAKVDYALKNGRHIQQWKEQTWWYRFIDNNVESLKQYYRTYFGVNLEYGGEATEKYYYLDFLPDSRGNIPLENRYFLQNEFVIIGFMLHKIIYIDNYIELSSVKAFQRMIRQDYEEFRQGLFRVLAKAKGINITQMNHDKVDHMVIGALKAFEKIGWVELFDDSFEVLPSFQRLTMLYGDYINNIDEWLKTETAK